MNKILCTLILGAFCGSIACGRITVERKNIVDNGGYLIRNAAITNITNIDLVLQAEPGSDDTIGNVILSPNEGEKNQKWGVAYYGGTTASLSPGLNRDNFVTSYTPTSGLFQRPHERQYTFANCYWNEEFKIRNEENKMCLCIVERDAVYMTDFAPCDDDGAKIFWTFERYG